MTGYVQYLVLYIRTAFLIEALDLILETLPLRLLLLGVILHVIFVCAIHQPEVSCLLDFILAVKARFTRIYAYVVKFLIIRSFRFVLQEVTLEGRVAESLACGMVIHDRGCDYTVLEFESRAVVNNLFHLPGLGSEWGLCP